MVVTLFERLGQPTPNETTQKPEPEPAQLLLTWLQRWNKPSVKMNEILVYGPSCTRKRKDAINATQILTEHGWLNPLETRRSNMLEWEIVRRPIVRPTIET